MQLAPPTAQNRHRNSTLTTIKQGARQGRKAQPVVGRRPKFNFVGRTQTAGPSTDPSAKVPRKKSDVFCRLHSAPIRARVAASYRAAGMGEKEEKKKKKEKKGRKSKSQKVLVQEDEKPGEPGKGVVEDNHSRLESVNLLLLVLLLLLLLHLLLLVLLLLLPPLLRACA
jgi:hypothetical protein